MSAAERPGWVGEECDCPIIDSLSCTYYNTCDVIRRVGGGAEVWSMAQLGRKELVELECDIRSPVYLEPPLTYPPLNHMIRFGCQVIDVVISAPSSIECLAFQNYYTHSITIKFVKAGRSTSDPTSWQYCIKDRILMPQCHCEIGSQQRFIFGNEEFQQQLSNIQQIRIILKQPSSNWNSFGINDLTLYCTLSDKQCFTQSQTNDSSQSQTQTINSSQLNKELLLGKINQMLQVTWQAHDHLVTSPNK